jgi:hypothetical protein
MVEIHKERTGPVFEYVLKLWVAGRNGELVPEEIRPKTGKAQRTIRQGGPNIAAYEQEESSLNQALPSGRSFFESGSRL